MRKIIIAIDGYSSCGKSTLAKSIAKKAGYRYIDSGAMYRAVTLYCVENRLFNKKAEINVSQLEKEIGNIKIDFQYNGDTGKSETYLNEINVEDKIRSLEISERVSPVSTLGFVRKEMVHQQQTLGNKKGIVMDGRDIGTTVFPKAEMKIFVTARPEVRAKRRFEELKSKGDRNVTFNEVLQNIEERDRIDSTRDISPLRKADDALVLDNSDMTIEEQDKWMWEQYDKCRNR